MSLSEKDPPKVQVHGRLLQQAFDDVEHLIETTADWDLDFWQLDAGRFQGEIFQAIAPNWQIAHARFDRKLKQHGLPPVHLRNIVVPGKSSVQFKWRGHEITGNSIMMFPLGGELDSISDSDFDVFIVGIPEDQLSCVGEALELPELSKLMQGAEVLDCAPEIVARLRHRLFDLTHQLTTRPGLLHCRGFAHAINTCLPQQIMQALAEGTGNFPMSIPKRKAYALQAAEAYIHDHAHRGLTVSQICEDLNVSDRTLRAAFCDRYGIPPKTYLKQYQLTQVHRQLRTAEPGSTTVGEIANEWGFWHMGQFAKDYAAMFGKLPSVTLGQTF
jgi:AraC family ethanolamine operon transcriptional activator